MTPPDSDARCSWIVSGARSGRCLLSSNHVGPHKPDDPREPDSDARCSCPPSDRELQSRGLLLRHVKACPLRTVLNATVPDSGKREVICRAFLALGEYATMCGRELPDASRPDGYIHCGYPREAHPVYAPSPPVSLPLSLAQRILAALDGHNGDMCQDCEALAAELRAHLPKEPK